jgi:hypothetical protein
MTYTYDWKKQTRVDYAEFMNPETKYDRVYYQIDVYNPEGKWINFGIVDDINDEEAVLNAVQRVIDWDRIPPEVLERMHSRFD